MAANGAPEGQSDPENEESMLDADEAEEEIFDDDEDAHMDSDIDRDGDNVGDELYLQNDSIAHFDAHKDSIFCIAQHPVHSEIVVTGGGDDTGYVFDTSQVPSAGPQNGGRVGLKALAKLDGHSDSINAVSFTKPDGRYLLTAGLDGQLRAYRDASISQDGKEWQFVASAQEVEEINFLSACPHPSYPNTVALGASDGSVWIYTLDSVDATSSLQIVQAFYLHTGPCTAGVWTPDGKLLCTVSEDGSFYAWDVFGEAAAAGSANPQSSQNHVVGLTAEDERFRVDGGLYSVNISPSGAFAAVGGAEGNVRIIGLPRFNTLSNSSATGTAGLKNGSDAKAKPKGSRQSSGPQIPSTDVSTGQAGQILASLQIQSDSVETISFSQPPLTLMAVGSVDGSIVLYDARHQFAVRRHIKDAHDGEAVIKVEFVTDSNYNWVLTSCGNDGVVKQWDSRGGTGGALPSADNQTALHEFKGHRGGGEGGGVLGFVQGSRKIVTAGDDGVTLIFAA